jgi:hypothetical protein
MSSSGEIKVVIPFLSFSSYSYVALRASLSVMLSVLTSLSTRRALLPLLREESPPSPIGLLSQADSGMAGGCEGPPASTCMSPFGSFF